MHRKHTFSPAPLHDVIHLPFHIFSHSSQVFRAYMSTSSQNMAAYLGSASDLARFDLIADYFAHAWFNFRVFVAPRPPTKIASEACAEADCNPLPGSCRQQASADLHHERHHQHSTRAHIIPSHSSTSLPLCNMDI